MHIRYALDPYFLTFFFLFLSPSLSFFLTCLERRTDLPKVTKS